jgi:SPP1 family holin
MRADGSSYARVIVAIFVIINNILLVRGYTPINDDAINAVITIAGNIYLLWPMWKNNYFTAKGKLQQKALIKQGLAKK